MGKEVEINKGRKVWLCASCNSGAKTLQEGWTEPPKLSESPHLVCIVIL